MQIHIYIYLYVYIYIYILEEGNHILEAPTVDSCHIFWPSGGCCGPFTRRRITGGRWALQATARHTLTSKTLICFMSKKSLCWSCRMYTIRGGPRFVLKIAPAILDGLLVVPWESLGHASHFVLSIEAEITTNFMPSCS